METLIENSIWFYIGIGILMFWVFPWKAVALWKSARNGHIWWFLAILFINTLAILEILYIFVFSRRGGAEDGGKKTVSDIKNPPSGNHNMQKPKMVL